MNKNKCEACPTGADCKDGKTFVCKNGFTASGNKCVCAKSQWINGNKCDACPANASCNGKTFKCKGKFTQVGNECLCPGGRMDGYGCYSCPKNGSCDNRGNVKCNSGYYYTSGACIKGESNYTHVVNFAGCDKGYGEDRYGGCVKCPAHATGCHGYESGYIRVDGCEKGYQIYYTEKKGSRCGKCPTGASWCTFDYNGKIEYASCKDGYILSSDYKSCIKE